MLNIFEVIGSLGLILITIALIKRNRKTQFELDVFGGIFLLIYSIWLRNTLFIILQLVFITAAVYELFKSRNF